MTINQHALSKELFDQKLERLLIQLEGKVPRPYSDTASGQSHPTVGIGFDLTVASVRQAVFKAMGIEGATATAITNAINNGLGKSTAQVQNGIDAAYGQTFAMTNSQITAVFREISASHVAQTKSMTGLDYSDELVALTSAHFNGLIGPKLQAALAMTDSQQARAEAWYQLRYVHEDQLHMRRYVEASVFGLYDNPTAPVSLEDAFDVYRMYTAHAKESLNGAPGMAAYDFQHKLHIQQAKDNLAAYDPSQGVGGLSAVLKPAADALFDKAFGHPGVPLPVKFDPLGITVTGDHQVTFTEKSAKGAVLGTTQVTFNADDSMHIISTDSSGRKTTVDVDPSDNVLTLFENLDGTRVVAENQADGGTRTEYYSSGEMADNATWGEADGHSFGVFVKGPPANTSSRTATSSVASSAIATSADSIKVEKTAADEYIIEGSRSKPNDIYFPATDTLYFHASPDGSVVQRHTVTSTIDSSDDALFESYYADGQLFSRVTYSYQIEEMTLAPGRGGHGFWDDGHYRMTWSVNPDNSAHISLVDYVTHAIGSDIQVSADWATITGDYGGAIWNPDQGYFANQHNCGIVLTKDEYGKVYSVQTVKFGGWSASILAASDGYIGATGMIVHPGVVDGAPVWRADYGSKLLISENGAEIGDNKIIYHSDGSSESSFISSDGTEYTETRSADFSTGTTRELRPDGSEYLRWYDGSELIKSYDSVVATDTTVTREFTQGRLVEELLQHGDGSSVETKFDYSGTNTWTKYTDATGESYVELMADDGSYSTTTWTGSGTVIAEFDPTGEKISLHNEFADGAIADLTYGVGGAASVQVYTGNDVDNTANGFEGRDVIYTHDGNDTLIGNAGDDELIGGAGDDTYVINRADGRDTIIDSGSTADKIKFGAGIMQGDLQFSRIGNDLVIRIGDAEHPGATDQATVENWYIGTANQIEQLVFADNSTMDAVRVTALGNQIMGTAGADTLIGSGEIEFLSGGSGDDQLNGGLGDDLLDGGSGADTYMFSRGDGHDIVVHQIKPDEAVDTLQFDSSISSGDLEINRVGDDLLVVVKNSNDSIKFELWFQEDAYSHTRIALADGTVWERETIIEKISGPTPGDDNLVGTTDSDTIDGGAGNDTIIGLLGADVLKGGEGNDWLHGDNGNSVITSVGDNDQLYGGAGYDTLYGRAGDDLLDGGTNDDYLMGGAGSDIYVFRRGDGWDTIGEFEPTAGDVDVIRFDASVAPSDVQVGKFGGSIALLYGDDDVIEIENFVDDENVRVEQVQFADGTMWDVTYLLAVATTYW